MYWSISGDRYFAIKAALKKSLFIQDMWYEQLFIHSFKEPVGTNVWKVPHWFDQICIYSDRVTKLKDEFMYRGSSNKRVELTEGNLS